MRMPELSHRQALAIALAVLVAAIVLGRLLTPSQAPLRMEPVTVEGEPAAPAELVVDVVGEVRRPGLYRLPAGSRVDDAVRRAQGATGRADLALVNLAAPLADGQQVVVPARRAEAAAGPTETMSAAAGAIVHLNSASLEDLDGLPGIGPTTAQRILDYRQLHG